MEKIHHLMLFLLLLLQGLLGVQEIETIPEKNPEIIYSERILSRSEGLEDAHVYQIHEDRKGYFWVVTEMGVFFYEGTKFWRALNHKSPEVFTKVSIRVEDSQGRLWIRYLLEDDINFRVIESGSRKEISLDGLLPEDPKFAGLKDITINDRGDLFIIDKGGNLWVKYANQTEWKYVLGDLAPDFDFIFRTNFAAPWIWGGPFPDEGKREMGLVDLEKGKVDIHSVPNIVFASRTEGDDIIYISKYELGYLDQSGTTRTQPLDNYFENFVPGRDSIIGNEQLWHYNHRTGEGMLIMNGYLDVYSFKDNTRYKFDKAPAFRSYFCAKLDDEGNIWVGTLEGLKHISFSTVKFEKIFWENPANNDLFHNNSCRGLLEGGDGKIYFTASDVFWVYSPEGKKIESIHRTNNGTSDIIWDEKRQLVWGFGSSGLFSYHPQTKKLKIHPGPADFIAGYIFGLYLFDDQITISNTKGWWVFDIDSGNYHKFNDYGLFTQLSTAEAYYFFEKEKGEVLVCTNKGVFRWEQEKGITGHYSVYGKGEFHIPAINVRHIHRDQDGVYWLATAEGLLKWQPEKMRTRRITRKDGLANDQLYAVYEDSKGFLWLSSNQGIIQYDKSSGKSKNFTINDGISDNEFNRLSHEQTRSGKIYFGSLNGMTRFQPEDLAFDFNALPSVKIQLSQLQTSMGRGKGKEDKLADFMQGKTLRIAPAEINFTLSCAVPDYDIGEELSFYYRLSNQLTDSWLPMEGNKLQIPVLPFGKYDLEIKVADPDLDFKESYLRIPLDVIPPLYKRPWFVTVVILFLFALSLYFGIRELRRGEILRLELERRVSEGLEKIARDKKLIEEQSMRLEAKALEKDRFFANISHEFRTPVSLILGPLDVLASQFQKNARVKELLEIAQRNARQLLKLINDVLLLSRVDYVDFKPNPARINLRHLIDSIAADFDDLFTQKKILFVRTYDFPNEETYWADKQMISVVLNNLLSNAWKFTPRGGKVTLFTWLEAGDFRLRVTDTGRGIHDTDMPYVFDRFYQSDRMDAQSEGGTGIGLAMVKELTEILGGSVSVESEWGKGSSFEISLSVKPAHKQELVQNRDGVLLSGALKDYFSPDQQQLLKGQQILLVEDNPGFYRYLLNIMGELFDLKTAANGREALVMLQSGLKPILIITDLMMPQMDGFQLIEQLKKNKSFTDIPVLVLTALAESQSRGKVGELGVQDYLVKPFEAREFFTMVSHLIGRYLVRIQSEVTEDLDISASDAWILELKEAVRKGMSAPEFSVNDLAALMLMGRTAFFNRVKKLTGLSPNQLIMEERLQYARNLLRENPDMTVKQIVKAVGLKHEPHFIEVFQKRFGYTPGQMKQE